MNKQTTGRAVVFAYPSTFGVEVTAFKSDSEIVGELRLNSFEDADALIKAIRRAIKTAKGKGVLGYESLDKVQISIRQ